ncbi:MAG: ketopantoate reductase family protein [Dehalococcoidia bacterium]
MRIAVVGGGGLGSVYAGKLALSGQDVVVRTRGGHIEAIRRDGLRLEGAYSGVARPALAASGPEIGEADLLILATKTYDTAEVLKDIDPASFGAVASVQNGVLKDDVLAAHFGRDKVVGCAAMVGAERTAPGVVHCTLPGETFFGEFTGEMSPRVLAIGQAFERAGLGVDVTPRVQSIEWTKQVLQCGTAPLNTITRMPLHTMFLGPAATVYREVIIEAAAVAAAHGVTLDRHPRWGGAVAELLECGREEGLELVRARGRALEARGATNIRISMQQDVAAGRRIELEETAGHIAREAQRLGIAAPYLDALCTCVRAIVAAGAPV